MVRRWYRHAVRATIDAAGRIVVPKRLREQLGFTPGTELELEERDGRLEVSVPSQATILRDEQGRPYISAPPGTPPLTVEDVRELIERGRR